MIKNIKLLDYFASQALIATFKNSVDLYNEGGLGEDPQLEKIYEDAAETAYFVAQEMMKQKAKYDSEQSR
jgi:hypothetical protein